MIQAKFTVKLQTLAVWGWACYLLLTEALHNVRSSQIDVEKQCVSLKPEQQGGLRRAEALLQWLKLAAWKVGDRRFEPRFGIQVTKKQIVASPLSRKDSILWGTSVIER